MTQLSEKHTKKALGIGGKTGRRKRAEHDALLTRRAEGRHHAIWRKGWERKIKDHFTERGKRTGYTLVGGAKVTKAKKRP